MTFCGLRGPACVSHTLQGPFDGEELLQFMTQEEALGAATKWRRRWHLQKVGIMDTTGQLIVPEVKP